MSEIDDKKKSTHEVEPGPRSARVQAANAQESAQANALAALDPEDLFDAVRFNRRQRLTKSGVRTLQRKLGVVADGLIGEATTRAIFAFQSSQGKLEAKGKLSPQTLEALSKLPDTTDLLNPPELTERQIAGALRYNKSQGLSREEIIRIQRKLNVSADGWWGRETLRALADWQALEGHRVSGRLDAAEREQLTAVIERGAQGPVLKEGEASTSQQLAIGRITAHFGWEEFASRGDKKAVPVELRANVTALCQELERLRAAFDGRPICINSGYRTPWWNKRIGGSRRSLHLEGMAADFTIEGVRPSRVRQKMEEMIEAGELRDGGLGRYATFTHYDIRPEAARWSG